MSAQRRTALRRTRILVIDLPLLLREIVCGAVADEPDMEIVAVLADGAPLEQALGQTGADVVVGGAHVLEPLAIAGALERYPQAKIFRVAADGRQTTLYERREWREISPAQLVAAIRTAARPDTI